MVKIYTAHYCEYCAELREKLELEKIKYNEINVNDSENSDECEKLFKFVGKPLIPIVIVGDRYIFAPKRSFNSIDQLIKLIKSKL